MEIGERQGYLGDGLKLGKLREYIGDGIEVALCHRRCPGFFCFSVAPSHFPTFILLLIVTFCILRGALAFFIVGHLIIKNMFI